MPALGPATAALSDAELRETMEKGWGVPQKFAATMREIWILQPQFDNRRGARPYRLLAQPRFRAAYDFLSLRAQIGEISQEMVDWWTQFQQADETTRLEMTTSQSSRSAEGETKRKRRKPRKRKPKAEHHGE